MGDRANVAIKTDANRNEHVFVYSHWGGNYVPQRVKEAVETAAPRWSDEPYCCKILIFNIIPTSDHHAMTGFGIDTAVGDNEYDIIQIDIPSKKIRVVKFDWKKWAPDFSDVMFEESFEDFIKLENDASWERLLGH